MDKYEFFDHPVELMLDGEHIITDLEAFQKHFEDQGWEYVDMLPVPTEKPNRKEVIQRFRRRV